MHMFIALMIIATTIIIITIIIIIIIIKPKCASHQETTASIAFCSLLPNVKTRDYYITLSFMLIE